jgi:NADH-quinone oxidoreductase subunit A
MLLALFEGYVPFVLMALIGLIVGGAVLAISKFMGPKRPTKTKELPYECGVDPIQTGARERYSVHFYLVAILFILFDLETVFLFPWAATFKDGVAPGPVKVFLFVEVLAFVAVLGAGLAYVWKRRGLEWD